MPKVSVIIPVYGVEKYIERCARSLFEQTLDDIEYLFVDDCSPDKSIEILKSVLEEYPNRRSQVIIHRMEQNSGQAAVRKWGMLNATGDYMIHCDSDDWVNADMYERMYCAAKSEGADVIRCYFDRVTDKGSTMCGTINEDCYVDKRSLIESMFLGSDLSSLCDKLVSRALCDKVKEYPTQNMWEDVVYCTQILMHSSKVCLVPDIFYHYRIHSASIVKNPTVEGALRRFFQAKANVELIEDIITDSDFDDKFPYALDCLKMRVKKELIPFLYKLDIYRLWVSTFSETNLRILRNPLLSLKGKIGYISSYVLMNPNIWKQS